MTNTPNIPNDPDAIGPPPRDELDTALRQWHQVNAEKAAAGRDRLLAALVKEDASSASAPASDVVATIGPDSELEAKPSHRTVIRRIFMSRYSPLAAAAIVLAALLPFIWPGKGGPVSDLKAQLASNVVMAPDGARLDAFDKDGNLLGPCALKHTDVKAEISGRFSRITVTQQFHNQTSEKIEAVYTFPLSDRGGVDRMTMTIGERVIVGEVKERQAARRIYDQAKQAGRVASLLEQERPNIFTQSVANIEPGASVNIEISYVELVAERDGEFSFDFPTVVGPRYIPGNQLSPRKERVIPLPAGSQTRAGLVVPQPPIVAKATIRDAKPGERTSDQLAQMLVIATPISSPTEAPDTLPAVWYEMDVQYPDGSGEPAVILTDGRGVVEGRWFFCPLPTPAAGEPFNPPTDKVPDADRITPMPVRPGTRAGHDISIAVTIDTGGPGITTLVSPLHEIARTDLARNANEQPRRVSIAMKNLAEIPNRDFVLKWKQTREAISYRAFTNTGPNGNFFAVQLDPPALVADAQAVPRELIFVVDTSGSMNGQPIALCRSLMHKAIDAMRRQDTFNIITFAGATKVMWDRPRPSTTANRDEAQRFIATWEGSGGTEMMTAINAALTQTPADGRAEALTTAQLADLPADGRQVIVEVDDGEIRADEMAKGGDSIDPTLFIREDLSIRCSTFNIPEAYRKRASVTVGKDDVTLKLLLRGTWLTEKGERLFKVASAELSHDSSVRPLRLVMFLTDAYVGNEFAIIDAIQKNRASTRVFSFGIGNSVNNWLINQMAIVGGGEPEFVFIGHTSEADAIAAVERFNRRTRTPVLTDISVTFQGVQPLDVLPDVDSVHDLWDQRPLTFLGRYNGSGSGTVTIKGQTAQGRWEKIIPITFPEKEPANSSLPTLWARAKVDGLMAQDLIGAQNGHPNPALRERIVQIGETFNIMSQYTSFVAVDKLRVTIAGKPRLVHIPIELPDKTNWEGFFGGVLQGGEGTDGKEANKELSHVSGTPIIETAAKGKEVLVLREEALGCVIAANDEYQRVARVTMDADGAKTDDVLGAMVFNGSVSGNTVFAPSPATPAPAPAPAPAGPAGPRGGSGGAPTSAGTPPPPPPPPGQPAITSAPSDPASAKPAAPSGRALHDMPKLKETEGARVWAERARTLSASRRESETKQTARDSSLASVSPNSGHTQTYHLTQPGTSGAHRFAGNDVSGLSSAFKQEALLNLFDNLAENRRGSRVENERAAAPRQSLMEFPADWPAKAFMRGDMSIDSRAASYGLEFVSAPDENLVVLAAAQLADSGRLEDAKRLVCSNAAVFSNQRNSNANLAADIVKQNDATKDAADRKAIGKDQPDAVAPKSDHSVGQLIAQAPIETMCGVLNSSLPDEQRKVAISQARAQASSELLNIRRDLTVARKLSPELFTQTSLPNRFQRASQQLGIPAQTDLDEKSRSIDARAAAGVQSQTGSNIADKSAAEPASRTQTSQPIFVAILLADTTPKTIEALKALGLEIISIRPEANVIIARLTPDKLEPLALLDIVKRIEPVPSE